MKIMAADEVVRLLEECRSADIRDYITCADDGEEQIDLVAAIEAGRGHTIQRLGIGDGKVFKLGLTNGQQARTGEVVYLIRAANGLVKIGYTSNLAHRFSALNNSSPLDLELIGCIETAIAETIEAELHAHFAELRVRGEWFRLTEDNIRFILSGKLWHDQLS